MASLRIKHEVKIFIIYLFFLLTIINCGGVYAAVPGLQILWQVILFIMFIIDLPKVPMRVINKFLVFILVLFIFVIIFLILNHTQYNFGFIKFFSLLYVDPIMFITIFLSHFKRIKYLFTIFDNIVIILSVISLVFWALSMLGVNPNMSVNIHWGGLHNVPGYFGLDFLSQGKVPFFGLSNIVRNTSIFTEAPMYSYVLCISLLMELFIRRMSVFNIRVLILLITIITTTSTTGLIIAVLALFYKGVMLTPNILLRVCILLLVPIIFLIINIILNNKIGSSTNQMSSYNVRMKNIQACYYVWKQHLLIGNGINNNAVIDQYRIGSYDGGESTGFMTVLAYGGILYSLLYVVPTVLFSSKSFRAFGLALLTFILFIYTIISNSYIYIMILSYFWACILLGKYYKDN